MLSIVLAGVLSLASSLSAQEPQDLAKEQARIAQNARTLANILSLPPSDVVPAIVKALRTDPAFAHDDLKHQAYAVLITLNAVRYSMGVRQFIQGLADPVVSCQCLYALGQAPSRYRDEVLPALMQYLDFVLSGHVAPCFDTTVLFEAIARLGPAASHLAPRFEKLVADTTFPVAMRGTAARTLVEIGGVLGAVRATEALLESDSIGARIMLNTILLEGETRQWSFLSGPRTRTAVAGLMSELLDVRPDRTYMERIKLKPDSKVLKAENRLLIERLEIGGVLTESIVRLNPDHARPVMDQWVTALHKVADTDPTFAVRLKALERLYRAEQLQQYAGLD